MLRIAGIYRYPVKGLSAEPLERIAVAPGLALPFDRQFAIAHASATVGETVEWMPKTSFATLARQERLAALRTKFDSADAALSIERNGKVVARGRLGDRIGRAVIEDFLAAFLKEESRAKPKIVRARDGAVLSDCREPLISIVNLASVRDLARVAGPATDPRRFRANLHFDGATAWEEFSWVGREIVAGGARLEIVERIPRCAAINVDPDSATRDLNLLAALQRGFGHTDMGVYARVTSAGDVTIGDEIRFSS